MTLEEPCVSEKEHLGDEGEVIICSRKSAPDKLTEAEVKAIEDMARFFLDKKHGKAQEEDRGAE